ncbi:MAG: mannitol dehydrogenase family protein [Aliishimia sp.]
MTHILHFGPGNFFRAHLAEYAFDAGDCEVTAVSLRSGFVRDGLATSGGAYTLAVQGKPARIIDVIKRVLVAPEDPEAVITQVASESVQVISATVTEKGYCLGADGQLDLTHPDISRDLKTGTPTSFIGYLAFGLARRTSPVTVLSCDNRMGNGTALATAVRAFCKAAALEITCDARFPNSMVDRITPATTKALIADFDDPMAVPCEPFKEWVIEDTFATARPNWPDVQWVADVAPHEMRKLRMLNGAHSYLAYSGVLAGHEFVHQAIADPVLRAGAQALMTEAATTLPQSVQGQAGDYARALIARFDNPHIDHALRQIAMDGTQKLPYRIVDSLRDRAGQGSSSPALKAAISAWISFCRAETSAGRDLQDPQAQVLARAQSDEDFLSLIGARDLN